MDNTILEQIRQAAWERLSGNGSGHDYYHAERVARTAVRFARQEGADPLVCTAAGYLHDYGRSECSGPSHTGPEVMRSILLILNSSGMDQRRIAMTLECIAGHEHHSQAAGAVPRLLESRILQDADRLDAMGAIGIARTFLYAGAHGEAMYRPELGRKNRNAGTAIGHFHDKLLTLSSGMYTDSGRRAAKRHHETLVQFLDAFYAQWDGEQD